jgi:hypothetical protein
MLLNPPTSQKADVRPISFLLDDQASGLPPVSLNLAIRPEDLVRSDSSRLNVQQTLGGAWADAFGPGIPTITISGHTGWRRTMGSADDGEARFHALKDQVFDQWHARRRDAVQAGRDPDLVQLIFADALDRITVVVAPVSFTLRRSKSRPLLFQYQINLTVLDQNVGQASFLQFGGGGLLNTDVLESLGLDSLTASINEITGAINQVQHWVDRTIASPVQAFMNQTARLYGAVRGAVAAVDGVAGSLIRVAQMTAQAGVNLFRTVAAVANIPNQIRSRLMQIAGAYSNIFCVLRNALRQQLFYEDYDPLFGASNCSSTSGGRPISVLAGQNPFYAVVPTQRPLPVSINGSAQSALRTLALTDPVLSPLPTASIRSAVTDIASGMVVSA